MVETLLYLSTMFTHHRTLHQLDRIHSLMQGGLDKINAKTSTDCYIILLDLTKGL